MSTYQPKFTATPISTPSVARAGRMTRGAGGRFAGMSDQAIRIQAGVRVTLDSQLQRQLQQVGEAMRKNATRSLRGAAYVISQFAKASIVTTRGTAGRDIKGKFTKAGSGRASRPGMPPHTRGIAKKNLRAAIAYDVDAQRGRAFIGPRASYLGDVMEVHEHGGRRRKSRGKQTYPKRPFMQPALVRAIPTIPSKFRGGLVGPGS